MTQQPGQNPSLERYSDMTPEELALERAKEYHDGWIEPDWRGRGAGRDVATRPLPPGQFDPADSLAPANPEPRPPLDSPTNFDGEGVEGETSYQSTISVSLDRITKLAADPPKVTPESCEAEDKFYRSGPGEPHCVSKHGPSKDDPMQESGEFDEADDILGMAEDDPRQFESDDEPFKADAEYPKEVMDEARGRKHLEDIHEEGEDLGLYEPEEKKKSALDKFEEVADKLNEKMRPFTDFIEAAMAKGGLTGPGTLGQLIQAAPGFASKVIELVPDAASAGAGMIESRIKKAMPEALRDLALQRAGQVAAKRAMEQAKAAEREAKEIFKKVQQANQKIARRISDASNKGTEAALDSVLDEIEKWSDTTSTVEEAEAALHAKEVVSKLQRVKRLRRVQDAPERYIPPRVKKALEKDPEQYLKNDRGLTSNLVAQAVGRSITKALGG